MATTQQRTQLAQTVGSSSATSILSSTQGAPVAIHTIFIVNTSDSDTTFNLYHDLDGTTYTTATALFWETDIPANSTLFIEGTGDKPIVYMDNASGNFAFLSCCGSGLTITLYGTVETLLMPITLYPAREEKGFISPGNVDTLSVSDVEAGDGLKYILKELRKINLHLSFITDATVSNLEVE